MRPLIQLSSSGGSSRCRSTSVEVGQLIRNSEAQQEIPATLITGLSLNSSEDESDGNSSVITLFKVMPAKPKGLRWYFGCPRKASRKNPNKEMTPRFFGERCTSEEHDSLLSLHSDIFKHDRTTNHSRIAELQRFLDSW